MINWRRSWSYCKLREGRLSVAVSRLDHHGGDPAVLPAGGECPDRGVGHRAACSGAVLHRHQAGQCAEEHAGKLCPICSYIYTRFFRGKFWELKSVCGKDGKAVA